MDIFKASIVASVLLSKVCVHWKEGKITANMTMQHYRCTREYFQSQPLLWHSLVLDYLSQVLNAASINHIHRKRDTHIFQLPKNSSNSGHIARSSSFEMNFMMSLNIALRSQMSDSPTKRTFLGKGGRETCGYRAASLWQSSSISLYFLETCNKTCCLGKFLYRQEGDMSSKQQVKHCETLNLETEVENMYYRGDLHKAW